MPENLRVPLISDSDPRVPAELGQESQASSWVEAWNPLASRGVPGETGHLSSGIWNLGFFSGRCIGESLPLRVDFIHRVEFEEVSEASGSYQEGTGKSGSFGMWNHPRGQSGMSS